MDIPYERNSDFMKLMIASDIHGSAAYCRQMIAAYQSEKPDRLLLLGDLLYHGPRNDLPKEYAPKAVIEALNALSDHILCVRGNCEAEVDQMVLDFPVLADYAWLNINGLNIFATHGHHFGKDAPPKLLDGDVLLCGHTHVPAFEKMSRGFYVNPGSVSIPKEDSPNSYLILEERTFSWKTLEGTVYRTESL